MTGDEYMTLLAQRRDAYEAEHPHTGPAWLRPLLEWFIQPGDEDLVTLPERPEKRPARPRTYRSADSLRAERDDLAIRAERIYESAGVPDRAASHGVALGQRRTARVQAANDRALARYTRLHERIAALDGRIARAERREQTTAIHTARTTTKETDR